MSSCKFLRGIPCKAIETFYHWDFCLWDFSFSMFFSFFCCMKEFGDGFDGVIFSTLIDIVTETAIVSFYTLPVGFPLSTISENSLSRLFCPLILDHGVSFIISISGAKIFISYLLLDTSLHHRFQSVIIRSYFLSVNLHVVQFQYGPGFHTRQPESLNVHISGFRPSKHHQNSTKGPPRERRKNENCGGEGKKSAKFWAVRRRGPAEGRSGEEGRGTTQILDQTHTADTHRVRRKVGITHKTAHNTRHTTHPTQPKQQHTNHTNHTTTHTPHTDVVVFVPSSVFYFVPMSFFCPACLFCLSRLSFFILSRMSVFFCPVAFFLSRYHLAVRVCGPPLWEDSGLPLCGSAPR